MEELLCPLQNLYNLYIPLTFCIIRTITKIVWIPDFGIILESSNFNEINNFILMIK